MRDNPTVESASRRWITTLVVAALMVIGFVPSASAAVTSVAFTDPEHVAGLGEPFPDQLEVTVNDDSGPVPGVEVAFSVMFEDPGVTVQLSATTGVTDAYGKAYVSATAGGTPGFAWVVAAAEGVRAGAYMTIRPPGYLPGETLASIEALDQDDVSRVIGAKQQGKQPFLLVDVCAGWCGPCRFFTQDTQQAIARLAILGIDVRLVTLLAEGDHAGQPSSTTDARGWKDDNGLTDPVFHAGGSTDSQLWRSTQFFLAGTGEGERGVPTHLLVDPRGKILDRVVGAQDTETTIERVLQHAKVKPPKADARTEEPVLGDLQATVPGGESYSHEFTEFDTMAVDGGFLALEGSDSSDLVSRSWLYSSFGTAPLAAEGSLEMSLTRFRAAQTQQLVGSTVQVDVFMTLGDLPNDPDNATVVGASTSWPALQDRGTVTVQMDMEALRTAIRAELESGRFEVTWGSWSELTPEMIDDLTAAMWTVEVSAGYVPRWV